MVCDRKIVVMDPYLFEGFVEACVQNNIWIFKLYTCTLLTNMNT